MIDLDYADPYAPQLAADQIVANGRRVRHRRRVIGGGGAFAVLAAIVCVAIIVPHHPGPATSAAPFDPAPGRHRPSDPVVIVATPIPDWHAYVYQSLDGGVCMGAAAYRGRDKGFVSEGCIALDQGPVIDPGVWVRQPQFQAAPSVEVSWSPATSKSREFQRVQVAFHRSSRSPTSTAAYRSKRFH